MEELSLDGLELNDFNMEDTGAGAGMEELSLDGLDLGEGGADDAGMEELSLDGLELDDFHMEDTEAGAGMEELSLDGLDLGESGIEDAGMDELSLDELALDELALDESEGTDGEMDGMMSEEDIDRLLSGDLSDDGGMDGFALEETGDTDEDLSALLAGMDHDEDLSEINNLLEESEQGVSPDDDMLAMLEGADDGGFDFFESDEAAREAQSIRELTPEEIAEREGAEKPKKEKKKRKKLFGKRKKENSEESAPEETVDELESLLGETAEQEEEPKAEAKEKKPGAFARFMNFLLESDEDEDPVAAEILAENGGEMGAVTDENRELLDELKEEDKKGKKKKKKDKKKGKKGKEGEGEEVEGEEEEPKKEKKKKKKEKKKKEEEDVDLFAPPEKKLSKKKVITVFVFCGTIAACIVLMASFLPDFMEKKGAHMAYDYQDYAEVYDLLYGKKLNEQDEIIFQRSNLILQMNRKLTSYDNYVNLNMRLEALHALIGGVDRYQEILPQAETYNVVGEISAVYTQILERLSADFGVSEADALEIIAVEDDVIYSQRLEAIINGAVSDEEMPTGRQDILPEEEEIIERIDGLESEPEADQVMDVQTDESSEEDMLPEEAMTDLESEEMEAEDSLAGENAEEDMSADENADEGAE